MDTAAQLDDRLVRALHEGTAALPDDLVALSRYLQTIELLLAEKAAEIEPTWGAALAAAAEIETLQALEGVVAERAIAVEAADLGGVRAKLDIWQALAAGAGEGDGVSARDRLVLSVLADLERLSRKPRA